MNLLWEKMRDMGVGGEDDEHADDGDESDWICVLDRLLGAQRESLRRTNRPAGPP